LINEFVLFKYSAKLQFDFSSPISVADIVASEISYHPIWAGMNHDLSKRVKSVLSLFSVEHLLKRTNIDVNPEEAAFYLDEIKFE
jgi:ABC-type Mn2+/Zn2+ transport system ATPase subunit